MKKLSLSVLGFFFFISATILFMNCDNNNDENDGPGKEDKKHYLTISYHSDVELTFYDENTSRYVQGLPADDRRYEIEKTDGRNIVYIEVCGAFETNNLLTKRWGAICRDSGSFLRYVDNYGNAPVLTALYLEENRDYHIELHYGFNPIN